MLEVQGPPTPGLLRDQRVEEAGQEAEEEVVAFQEFNPPASAYPFVASLMPKRYFLEQPPERGQRLTVIGRDGVATSWDVEDGAVARLVSQLSARGLKVVAHPYEGGPRAAA